MISVIVPVYNVERYLRRCVDSILQQTYRDLEVILVDDGATDGSPRICDEYAGLDPRVKVVHKPHGGAAEARNAGLDAARGEYIGFVDSDDFILPEMYETLYRACVEHGVAVSACGKILRGERGGIRRRRHCLRRPALFGAREAVSALFMGRVCDSSACDKLYRRELFSDIRYPAGAHYDDLDVTARLLDRSGGLYHVGKPLYVYCKRSGSVTTMPFHEKTVDAIEQAERLKSFMDAKYPDLQRQSLHFVCMNMGNALEVAYRCRNPGKREAMNAAVRRAEAYLLPTLLGVGRLRHKAWIVKNYVLVRLRLRRWRNLP